jgi:hypothetical protein
VQALKTAPDVAIQQENRIHPQSQRQDDRDPSCRAW